LDIMLSLFLFFFTTVFSSKAEELAALKKKIMAMKEPEKGMQEFIDKALERKGSFIPAMPPIIVKEPLEVGDHIWWYDAENQWWMTGKMLSELGENGKAKISPTHLPGNRAWPVRVLVRKPNMQTNMWKSQKMRDMGELARVDKDDFVAKELFLAGNILDKNNPHTSYSLGIWHLFGAKERDFEKAKDLMIATIARDKGWWRGYHGLGVTYRLWRKNADALRILDKAFERHPLSTKVLDDLGHVNFELEKYEESCFYYLLLDQIRSFMKKGITLLPDRIEFCKMQKSEL